MIVEDIMSTDPYVVEVTETVRQVLAKLLEANVRHLPVVDEGAIVGIVSDRDLHRAAASWLAEQPEPNPLERSVSAIMSSDVISVHPETDVQDVIDLMLEHKIGAIPVLEADSAKVIGIISYVDILRGARDLLE